MKTQVVRAGKFLSVGIIVLSSLPVLFPLLLLLCVFGFVVVVPLGCTLVGFLYLRKYAEMLYRKLPAAPSRLKSSASAGPVYVVGHVDITDPIPRDSQALQTYEELDREFDALLVSSIPPLVCTHGDEIAEDGIGSGALPISNTEGEEAGKKKSRHAEQLEGISSEGSKTESLADEASGSSDFPYRDANLGEAELNKESEQLPSEEANDSLFCARTCADAAGEGEYSEADSSGGALSSRDVSSDSCILEQKELEDGLPARDLENLVEDTPNVAQTEDDGEIQISQEENNIQNVDEGKIHRSAFEDFNNTNVTLVDQGIQELHETPSPADIGGEEGGANQPRDIAVGGTAENMVKDRTDDGAAPPQVTVDGSAEKMVEDRTQDGAHQLPCIVVNGSAEMVGEDRTRNGANQLPDIVVDGSAEKIGEDRMKNGAGQQPDIVVDGSAERIVDDRFEDGADELPDIVVDGSTEQIVEDGTKDGAGQLPDIGVDGSAEKVVEGRKKDVANELPDDTSEETNEERKEYEASALSNDVAVKEARTERERHGDSPLEVKTDVDSDDASLHTTKGLGDHVFSLTSGDPLTGQEDREGSLQARSLDSALGKVDEDEEWGKERASLVGVVKAPDSPSELPVSRKAQSEKSRRSGALLPHQVHEGDIWICKECGWRYPNAKPSAKIRRNHKKHCKGRGPPAVPFENRLQEDLPPQCHVLTGTNKRKAESGSSKNALGNLSPKRSSGAGQSEDELFLNTESVQCSSSVALIEEEVVSGRSAKGAIASEQGAYPQSEAMEAELSSHLLMSSPAENPHHEIVNQRPVSGSVAVDTAAAIASSHGRYQDAVLEAASQSFRSVGSESFRSAQEAFFDDGDPCSFSSYRSEKVNWDDDRHQPTQVQIELQLRNELISMREIVGDQRASAGGLLLTEIHELSDFLGIDLPAKGTELPDLEWARVAVEVMKIVVGVD